MKYILKDKGNVYDLIPNLNDIVKSTDITLELTEEELDKLRIELRPFINIGGYTKCPEIIHIVGMYSIKNNISAIKTKRKLEDLYKEPLKDIQWDEEPDSGMEEVAEAIGGNKGLESLGGVCVIDDGDPLEKEVTESLQEKTNSVINTCSPKKISFRYLQWNDNLSEMKMFCGNDCIITYEYAPGLDCYWMLVVDTINKDGYTSVPLGHYVIKLFEGFIVVSPHTFKKYFNVGGKES